MAFKEERLDSTIDFEGVGKNEVNMITGNGQMVYWKGCNVTVIEKESGGEEKRRPLYNVRDGQGRLPLGSKLYVTHGMVKEE